MVYQIHANLKDSSPKIWRRFYSDPTISLTYLMEDLLKMFHMDGSHLYGMHTTNRTSSYIPGEFEYLMDNKYFTADEYLVSDAFSKEKSRMYFLYDFGDSWLVELKLEKIYEDVKCDSLPYIKKGEGYGIIEDAGGVWELEKAIEWFKILKEKFGDKEYDDLEEEDFERDVPSLYFEWYWSFKDIDFEKCDVELLNKKIGRKRI